jgi:hypothetical protein
MDLKQTILDEHSKKQCMKIVNWVGNNEDRFAELMKLFFDGDNLVAQRAGWPISYCVMAHPKLAEPYFKKLIDLLNKPSVHNAIHRNIVRLLQSVEIPGKFEGQVMDTCFNFIQSPSTPAAVKAFSITCLENLSKKYPEILPELRLIIEERWDTESAAFRSRARRILKTGKK